jgi:hypothetical protein
MGRAAPRPATSRMIGGLKLGRKKPSPVACMATKGTAHAQVSFVPSNFLQSFAISQLSKQSATHARFHWWSLCHEPSMSLERRAAALWGCRPPLRFEAVSQFLVRYANWDRRCRSDN